MASLYLQALERGRLIPNFWCSEEYWEKAGWEEHFIPEMGLIIIGDEEGRVMLPPMLSDGRVAILADGSLLPWAGIPGLHGGSFLDFQFIYSAIRSLDDLKGGVWRTTRKNINKVQRERGNIISSGYVTPTEAQDILIQWTQGNGIEEYNDPEVLTKYVLDGEGRIPLFYEKTQKMAALLVYDENYKYINFRYCITDNLPGTSDYVRMLFRVFMYNKGKLINDGGALGRPGLDKYKRRLNPVQIHEIRSFQ